MKNAILGLVALTLTACVNESGARMGLFSATAPVIAVLQDDLFLGEAVGYIDRTGTINIQSTINPDIRCIGEFRYTGSRTGTASIRCNDGNVANISFNSLSALSGYGVGSTFRGPASFTYGLTPEQASQYLTLPQGKTLDVKNGTPTLHAL